MPSIACLYSHICSYSIGVLSNSTYLLNSIGGLSPSPSPQPRNIPFTSPPLLPPLHPPSSHSRHHAHEFSIVVQPVALALAANWSRKKRRSLQGTKATFCSLAPRVRQTHTRIRHAREFIRTKIKVGKKINFAKRLATTRIPRIARLCRGSPIKRIP